jgi:probable HAF family extracellular repeat protein
MKSEKSKLMAVTVLFAVAALPFRIAAEAGEEKVHYKLITLGTLGGSVANPFGGINDRTWLTGDSSLAGDLTEHGFLWRDGAMIDLGTLGGQNSSVGNPTTNVKGLIVGNAQTGEPDPTGDCTVNPSTGEPTGECWGTGFSCPASTPCQGYQNLVHGFVWKDGAMSTLPTLGGNNSGAFGANNRGQIVGVAETNTFDPNCVAPQQFHVEAVVWGPKPGEIRALPPLPGDVMGGAQAINDRGQVVGGSGPQCGWLPFPTIYIAHAVLWQDGKPIDLGSLGGVENNLASAINNRGQVVGTSDLPGDVNTPPFSAPAHAFLWQDGVMTDLGTLPAPLDFSSGAGNINESGQVVGTSCDASFNCHGFLWEDGVMTDLNALLPAGTALQVIAGGGINDRGEIAVQVFDPATGTTPLALMIPDRDPVAAQLGFNAVSTDALPDHVRTVLQQRMKLGPFGRAPSVIPAHSTRPNADALVSTLAGAKPSTSNAAPQSCQSLGAACGRTGPYCCKGSLCGPHGTCCDKPFHGMACTSSAQCCSGVCVAVPGGHLCN